jgi:hypothetical protein
MWDIELKKIFQVVRGRGDGGKGKYILPCWGLIISERGRLDRS